MRATILEELAAIEPLDDIERRHLADARAWINSGAGLYRLQKPATPPKHLVSYFPILDEGHILLVDHRNARRWLPAGGHVEPDWHLRETVRRDVVSIGWRSASGAYLNAGFGFIRCSRISMASP